MTNNISTAQAKKRSLGAQGASVIFLLAAVALGAVGLPKPASQASIETTTSPIQAPTPSPSANPLDSSPKQSVRVDTVGLGERFALLDNAPAVITKAVVLEPNTTPDTIETAQGGDMIRKRVQYIGFINDPPSRHAFIRIDGKQRVVALGGVAKAGNTSQPDLKIDRISPKSITLSDGDASVTISLANRIGQSITMASGNKVEVAQNKPDGSMLTDEDKQYIAELAPAARAAAKRRIERERRGLPKREKIKPANSVSVNLRESRSRSRNN